MLLQTLTLALGNCSMHYSNSCILAVDSLGEERTNAFTPSP